MNGNLAIDYGNPTLLWQKGIDALTRELGPVGMAYFIRQFSPGYGDYTKEREELLKDVTLDSAREELGL